MNNIVNNDDAINFAGSKEKVADVDIYVNGGSEQPGCPSYWSGYRNWFGRKTIGHSLRNLIDCGISVLASYICNSMRALIMLVEDYSRTGQCQPVGVYCRSWGDFQYGDI